MELLASVLPGCGPVGSVLATRSRSSSRLRALERGDLAADVGEALEANPVAGAFFDSLAQFYRKGYLRWIDGTKRRPEVRAQRIAEMIRLLNDGIKERPRP